MSGPATPSDRLQRLQQILAGAAVPRVSSAVESITLDRIRLVTAELEGRTGAPSDDIDVLTERLLLNDYAATVAHLRTVAQEAGRRIDRAAAPMKDIARFLWRADKLRESRVQASADE